MWFECETGLDLNFARLDQIMGLRINHATHPVVDGLMESGNWIALTAATNTDGVPATLEDAKATLRKIAELVALARGQKFEVSHSHAEGLPDDTGALDS